VTVQRKQPKSAAPPKKKADPPLARRLFFTESSKPHPKFALPDDAGEAQEATRKKIIDLVKSGEYPLNHRNCEICGSRDFHCISQVERYGLNLPTSICRKCGLVQSNPILTNEAYLDFYRFHYRNLYGGKPHESEIIFRSKASKRGAKMFQYVEQQGILADLAKTSDLIVEVGCGDGSILSYFADQGYKTIGIDLDEKYMTLGRRLGYDLRTGPLSNVRFETAPKLIYYHHVMEHIVDLNEEIARISAAIADDGYLVIIVPGIKNFHFAYGGDLLTYLQIAHVSHFSLATLELLFLKHGFELISGDEAVRAVFRKIKPEKKWTFTTKKSEPSYFQKSEYFSCLNYIKKQELVITRVVKEEDPTAG
jgi:SAM-dependent methyltransferase